MSVAQVRTGSTEAPASVRRGVIRRRLRWAARVGMVLVLALVLSVVGAIRSNQQAQALAPMLAPAAPVLVASGPAGWAVLGGAGVILGGVYLADKYRQGESGVPDQTPLDWLSGLMEDDALSAGIKDWFSSEDKDKGAQTTNSAPPAGSITVAKPADISLRDFRETSGAYGSRQVSADIFHRSAPADMTPGWKYADASAWAMVHKHCRLDDGSVVPEIRAEQLAMGPGLGQWGPYIMSQKCTTGRLLAATFNPMTEADFKTRSTQYPRTDTVGNNTFSIDRGYSYMFPDAYEGTDGTKTTVTCVSPDGEETIIAGSSRDADGVKVPTCPDGYTMKGLKLERTKPDGSVQGPPVAEAEVKGERPVDVLVDGQPCTMGREGCANWTEVRDAQPERVQCVSGGVPVHVSNCNTVERFYENGGTAVHPHNIDGNPATYWDPWQDPNWKPVYQDPSSGDMVLAPERPTTRPPATSPDDLPWDPEDPQWEVPDTVPTEWTEPTTAPDPEPTSPEEPEPSPTVDPYTDPSSPLYDPTLDPNAPEYDPRKDPKHPEYDPVRDPRSPDYDPTWDPAHPDYVPEKDPEHPDYDPAKDPTLPQPEPEPSTDPEPEPTSPAEPEPSPEPTGEPSTDPEEGEDPEPEPTGEPSEEPTMEPQPGEAEPPVDPPPTGVKVDEYGHLVGITATTGVLDPDSPATARTYVQPETGVRTQYAPDGTTTTTFTAPKVETPTGTQPLDIITVTAPDGTRTTTGYPSVPEIETPGKLIDVPSRGVHPPIEVTEGTCESTLCVSIPEPPEDMMTRNCMKGGWSWNPIDWVKTPVVCALREAFEPDPEKLDANVHKLRMALEARGFSILINSFETTVTAIPGGGGGCMGPPITAPIGGESHTFYFFQACDGAIANVATYVNYFIMLASGLFGFIAVIRNIAYGFGHTVKVAEGGEGAGS